MLTSMQNEQVKLWTRLKQKKYRDDTGLFLIEGEHLVSAAKQLSLLQTTVTTNPKYDGILVTEAIMSKLTDMKSIPEIMGVCYKSSPTPILGPVLVCDRVQDPGNIGTLLRSALAFGFHTVMLSQGCADIYSPKVLRATQGALFELNIYVDQDIHRVLDSLKSKDYTLYGTTPKPSPSIQTIAPTLSTAILLGNEGSGLAEDVFNRCDALLHIETQKVESLNVAISGSLSMYAWYVQSIKRGKDE